LRPLRPGRRGRRGEAGELAHFLPRLRLLLFQRRHLGPQVADVARGVGGETLDFLDPLAKALHIRLEQAIDRHILHRLWRFDVPPRLRTRSIAVRPRGGDNDPSQG
jgi:hypothetical protein